MNIKGKVINLVAIFGIVSTMGLLACSTPVSNATSDGPAISNLVNVDPEVFKQEVVRKQEEEVSRSRELLEEEIFGKAQTLEKSLSQISRNDGIFLIYGLKIDRVHLVVNDVKAIGGGTYSGTTRKTVNQFHKEWPVNEWPENVQQKMESYKTALPYDNYVYVRTKFYNPNFHIDTGDTVISDPFSRKVCVVETSNRDMRGVPLWGICGPLDSFSPEVQQIAARQLEQYIGPAP